MKSNFAQSFFSHFTGTIVGSGIMGVIIKNINLDELTTGQSIALIILLYVFLIITSIIHAIAHEDRK